MTRTAAVGTRPLLRAVGIGLLLVVAVSIAVEVLDRNVDDFDSSWWMLLPVLALLAVYAVTGALGARAAPAAPLATGALAALGTFAGWLVVRCAWPLVQGDTLGFGIRTVVVNALLAAGFGTLGALATDRRRPPI